MENNIFKNLRSNSCYCDWYTYLFLTSRLSSYCFVGIRSKRPKTKTSQVICQNVPFLVSQNVASIFSLYLTKLEKANIFCEHTGQNVPKLNRPKSKRPKVKMSQVKTSQSQNVPSQNVPKSKRPKSKCPILFVCL